MGPADKEHAEDNVDRRQSNESPCSRSALIIALFQAMRLPQMLSSSSCTCDLPEQEQAKIGAMPATTSLFVDSTVSIFRACWTVGASLWALRHAEWTMCRVVRIRRAAVRQVSALHRDLHRLTFPVCVWATTATGKRGEDDDDDGHRNKADEVDVDRDAGTDREELFEAW